MAPWWLRSHIDEEVANEETGEESPEIREEQEVTASPTAEASAEREVSSNKAKPVETRAPQALDKPLEGGEAAGEAQASEQAQESNTDSSSAPQEVKKKRRRRRRRRGAAKAPSETVAAELPEPDHEAPKVEPVAAPQTPKVSQPPAQAAPSQVAAAPVASAQTAPAPAALAQTAPAPAASAQTAPAPALHADTEDDDMESVSSGVLYVPDRTQSSSDERKIAMFLDFENIALGVRDSETKSFDVSLILERLLEKGKIVVKRAYADWERYSDFKRPLHEAAIELIDIPQKHYSGKNSADIKMVVDAIDLCYAKDHLDTFVLVTGDSDFSPLVSKLKENDKYVIGLGVKNSTSHLLIDNCDEFIYYEDVWRDTQQAPRLDHLPPKEAACFQLMSEAMLALFREGKDVIWGSQLKQTIKRKRPSFHEGYYGYNTFSEMLQDAERKNIVRLRRDRRSGGYIVAGFAPRTKR